ncbi:hypothetical protein [Oryzihumus leptocrescens]|uniref:Lipoprotein n=1 Tax=Oryzihumus leptocrescens TaxID=297536 RepID=A0A542ZHP9_9MICO|nr:hypothetical protein [Oryzihumus leptocrescens]TQL59855.1 hypothetical protein FB474_1224 [Oryzihumus leptocrescens]
MTRGRGHAAGAGARVLAGAAALLLAGALTGCESAEQKATESAADQMSVCARDASAVELPAAFSSKAALPDGYVVTHVESRDGGRVVVTAVSPKPFRDTLKDMQATYARNGWSLSEGEVEADDAESNFSGNGLKGRWAIRAMDACKGNTAVSLVTGATG